MLCVTDEAIVLTASGSLNISIRITECEADKKSRSVQIMRESNREKQYVHGTCGVPIEDGTDR